jgi:hypothetical protein
MGARGGIHYLTDIGDAIEAVNSRQSGSTNTAAHHDLSILSAL